MGDGWLEHGSKDPKLEKVTKKNTSHFLKGTKLQRSKQWTLYNTIPCNVPSFYYNVVLSALSQAAIYYLFLFLFYI